jgi:hypothetical protein
MDKKIEKSTKELNELFKVTEGIEINLDILNNKHKIELSRGFIGDFYDELKPLLIAFYKRKLEETEEKIKSYLR